MTPKLSTNSLYSSPVVLCCKGYRPNFKQYLWELKLSDSLVCLWTSWNSYCMAYPEQKLAAWKILNWILCLYRWSLFFSWHHFRLSILYPSKDNHLISSSSINLHFGTLLFAFFTFGVLAIFQCVRCHYFQMILYFLHFIYVCVPPSAVTVPFNTQWVYCNSYFAK